MEPGIDRPQSALARGVQITEFNESQVNPEPIVIEETDLLMEQYLSPRKLVSFSGIFELCLVKTCLQGFRPGLTQTRLYNHKRWLEV